MFRKGSERISVLFFYQHFWPDSPPYAAMLRSIGSRLNGHGIKVGILTAQPSYKPINFELKCASRETLDFIEVKRLSTLPGAKRIRAIALLGKVLFPIRGVFVVVGRKLLGDRPDVIVAATIPPVLNGACGLLAARIAGAKFVYHMQDIYPEIGVAGGIWSRASIRYKFLYSIDAYIARRADACVVLSKDMQNSLIERGVRKTSTHIINNFMLESFDKDKSSGNNNIDSLPQIASASDEREQPVKQVVDRSYRIVFAGNIGRFQALEQLLDAFMDEQCQHLPLELHFLGDGAVKAELQTQAGNSSAVHFHGHVPFEKAAKFIQECDAGIVSISPDVIKYAYPSKTLSYLGLGVPLFAVVEQQSELASDIENENLGVVCKGLSKEALVESYQKLAVWLDDNKNSSDRIEQHAKRSGSPSAATEKWKQLIDKIV